MNQTTSSIVQKLRTGVPGLDVITHGGLPKGRTTLVCGRSPDGETELRDVHISEPSLENLFLHHTGRSLRP